MYFQTYTSISPNTNRKMMRLLTVFFFLTCCNGLFAQDWDQHVLYFESAAYQLSPNQKKELGQFLGQAAEIKDPQYSIQAFTDNVGDYASNQLLAKNRTETFQKYLLSKGVDQAKITVQKARIATQATTAERQEFRKVILTVYAKNYNYKSSPDFKELNAFFAKEREAAKQKFEISADQEEMITAAQGTEIRFPANSLTRTDGKAIQGPIQVEVIEAYKTSDILLQNLSTTSGDRMLETGGMVFIEAKDLDGTKLTIKEGANVQMSLSSEEALGTGMQIFEGKESVGGDVDWKNTEDWVQRGVANEFEVEAYSSNMSEQIEERVQYLVNFPSTRLDALKEVPKLSNKKIKQYLKDPSRFEEDKKIQEYIAFSDEVRAEMIAKINLVDSFDYPTYMDAWFGLDIDYERLAKAVIAVNGQVQFWRESANQYNKEGYDFKSFIEELEQAELYEVNAKDSAVIVGISKAAGQGFSNIVEYLGFPYGGKPHENLLAYEKWLKKEQKTIQKLYDNLSPKGTPLTKKELASLLKFNKKKIPSPAYQILEEEYQKFMPIYKNKAQDDVLIKIEGNQMELNRVKEMYEELRKAYGILKPDEIYSLYRNSLNLNQLAWINCDRFFRYKGPRGSIELLAQKHTNVQFYLILKEIRSVIAVPYKAEQAAFISMNLPLEMEVKIVGLRTTTNAFYFFEREGKAQDLQEVEANFKLCTEAEMRASLGSLQ